MSGYCVVKAVLAELIVNRELHWWAESQGGEKKENVQIMSQVDHL
jgi:hypothetical protein